jgi:hypothetical protein
MKEFLISIWVLIWACIMTILVHVLGTPFSLFYSIWLTITLKKPFAFFKFWWRFVDGLLFAIGYIFYEIAYGLDLTWNVNGEAIEDLMTTEENTTFTDREISVSASIGKLEIDGKLKKFGKGFSKVLNFAFNQKQHAIDAWYFTKAKKELRGKYFEKRK